MMHNWTKQIITQNEDDKNIQENIKKKLSMVMYM